MACQRLRTHALSFNINRAVFGVAVSSSGIRVRERKRENRWENRHTEIVLHIPRHQTAARPPELTHQHDQNLHRTPRAQNRPLSRWVLRWRRLDSTIACRDRLRTLETEKVDHKWHNCVSQFKRQNLNIHAPQVVPDCFAHRTYICIQSSIVDRGSLSICQLQDKAGKNT